MSKDKGQRCVLLRVLQKKIAKIRTSGLLEAAEIIGLLELWFVKTFHEQLKGHLYCK